MIPAQRRTRLADVGAVVVTHRRPELALACVESLVEEVEPKSIAVVVNDPAACDPQAIARVEHVVGHVVLNSRPVGYGENVNIGFGRLPAELRYSLLVNDDVVAEPGLVERLRRELESDPTVALVGAQLVDGEGRPQTSYHRFPSLASELADALMLPRALQPLASRFSEATEEDVARDQVWPVGAVLLVRADAFRAVGGFDQGYFLYSEETDLAWRLREAGFGVRFCADAVARHLGSQSTGGGYERLLGISRWRYVRKHWSPLERLGLLAGLPLVYAWNVVYTLILAVAAPRSGLEKWRWWRRRWVKRSLPALGVSPAVRPRRR